MKTRFLSVCFCVSFLFFLGCRNLPPRSEGMPELVECTVAVTFGGEAMEGVGILLQPKDKEKGNWPAGGQTDAQGKAVMKTAAYYQGVAPGEYVISFQKFEPEGMGPGKSLIPLKYSTSASQETILITESQTEYVFTLDALDANAKK